MADGSLREAAFRHYLVQDYLFLIEFARAYAVAHLQVAEPGRHARSRRRALRHSRCRDGSALKLCAGWGLSPEDLDHAPPAVEMRACTSCVLDTGMRGDLLALKVALAPCVIGYAEIAARLAAHPQALAATDPYRVWIAEYARHGLPGGRGGSPGATGSSRRSLCHAAREAELIAIFRKPAG